MFEKVLLPTDFSEYARKTMEYVNEIPGIREAILLYVAEEVSSNGKGWIVGRNSQSPSDRAWKTLQEEKEYLEAKKVPSRIKIESAERGDIAGAIVACADKENVSLIMMGARGMGIVEGFLLGSVSSRVLRNAKTHILITQYRPLQKRGIIKRGEPAIERYPGPLFRKLLIPVDFSRLSTEVIEFVRDIEGIEEIILLHVISDAEGSGELEMRMKDSYKRLQYLAGKIDLGDIPVKIRIRFGSPAEEICNMADEEGATMIMVSRFGVTGEIKNILIGDTVLEVAKNAKRPVFVKYPILSPVIMARELQPSEFPTAEEIWTHYRQQRANLQTDRIFGVFLGDALVCVARCRRYLDDVDA